MRLIVQHGSYSVSCDQKKNVLQNFFAGADSPNAGQDEQFRIFLRWVVAEQHINGKFGHFDGNNGYYMKKEELARIIGPDQFARLTRDAEEAGGKLTSAALKSVLLRNEAFVEQFRNSANGRAAFEKYRTNYIRMTNPAAKAKRVAARKAMSEPRRGFLGCLATKVEPSDFKDCVDHYDRPEYQDIKLVPSNALRVSAFRKTANPALVPSPHHMGHVSNLPSGLRAYIKLHPADYEDYIEERKSELEFLKNVRRNARREERAPAADAPAAEEGEGDMPVADRGKRRRDLPVERVGSGPIVLSL